MVGLLMYIAVIIAWSVLPSGSDGLFHIVLFIVVGIVTGLLPCALMSVYVISSTTASEFITGMKKLFIPDVITIPMSVIFRFFPTVKEEIQAINKAMTMRGIRFGGRNAAGILEYRLIPILMCSLKIGDELSAAALTRGLDSPRKRTNICDTRFRFQDFFFFGTLLLCLFGMGIESIRNSLRGGCEAMIELKNVSFTYLSENSDESSAELNGSLSNIDLRIEKGFLLCFLQALRAAVKARF